METALAPELPEVTQALLPVTEPDFLEHPFQATSSSSLLLRLPPPDPRLRVCIVVPARNEETVLPSLIAALAGQVGLDGAAFNPEMLEIIILLNNCSDRSATVLRDLRFPCPLKLHTAEITLGPHEAHVGRARQILFDTAYSRLRSIGRADGLILTTDADTRPEPDWVAQICAEFAKNVSGVGGRILLEAEERATLPVRVQQLFLLDVGYRRALEEMRSLYAPQTEDPFPRHHQHYGASLAVTAAAYAKAGGMPLTRSSEDAALYRAVVGSGGKFRHSYRVRVRTSARVLGRAEGGLAFALGRWRDQANAAKPVIVESAEHADERLGRLGLWCATYPDTPPPTDLAATPESLPQEHSAEIHATLNKLRQRICSLRSIPLHERLQQAVQQTDAISLRFAPRFSLIPRS
ncbi:MAG: glycosyltransferase [Verrucomicrobia bacterium]|nr:glycosyltransferase [Verrucomicrobiota bacterium]